MRILKLWHCILCWNMCFLWVYQLVLFDYQVEKTHVILFHQGQCHMGTVEEDYFFISRFLFTSITVWNVCLTRPIWNISSSRTFAGFRLISLTNVISLYGGALLCLCRSSFFLGLAFLGKSWVKYIWKRHIPDGYEVFDYVSFKCYKDRLCTKIW